MRQDGVSGSERRSCTFLALSQLFLQLLIVGTEMVPLSLPVAQLQLQVLCLLPCIILEEVRTQASPHRATTSRRQRGTNTKAEIAKVAGGNQTVMVDVITILLSPHGSKPTQPTRIYTHSGFGTLLVSSAQQRDRISGCTRHTLPELAESASGADTGLVGLLPLRPL